MRILGIDYGEKRIGLAVSDESHTLARALDILSPKQFFSSIRSLVAQYEVETILLGLPLNMDGKETKKTDEVKAFKASLEKEVSVPIVFFDERLSSVMARTAVGGKGNIDNVAAQLILQNYLDTQKNS